MILTARELLLKLANDSGLTYQAIANRVNRSMQKGKGFIESVRVIAEEKKLDSKKYKINPENIMSEALKILNEDYTQTLMISAVLGQMVESKGKDRFPPPAFFAFIEIISQIEHVPQDMRSETSTDIEERTTRIIELMTTLVSLLCDWSEQGVTGVAFDCPNSLREIARSIFRKTKLLQGGLWTCISCGNIVDIKETKALLCHDCDSTIGGRRSIDDHFEMMGGRNRNSYGHTENQ